jgi:hypothetical protein
MRYKKVRVFFVNQHEKEEKWLNDMAAKGFAMVSIRGGIFYEFEQCEPGEYIYRLELLENTINTPESMNYIQFIEDTGAEMIGSWVRWVYFRKKASEGAFDLFSDLDSKINHYVRIRNFILPFTFLEFSCAVLNVNTFIASTDQYSSFAQGLRQTNLFYALLLSLLSIMFLLIFLSLQKRINELKKEQMIRE